MPDSKDKVKGCVHPEEIGLMKEIIEYLFEKDNYRERDYEIFLKGKGVI